MSRYAQVNRSIWSDQPFRLLSADAGHLYFWCFTTKLQRSAGIFKAHDDEMSLYAKLTGRRLAAAKRDLARHRMVFFGEDGWVWVRSYVRNVQTKNEGYAVAVVRDLREFDPAHPMRVAFVAEYRDEAWLEKADRAHAKSPEKAPSWSTAVAETLSPTYQGGTRGVVPLRPAAPGDSGYHPGSTQVPYFHFYSPSSLFSAVGSSENASTQSAASRARGEADVLEVWEHYLDTFYPGRRGRLPDLDAHLVHIEEALRVRDVETCKLAITGLARSDFHQSEQWTEIRYALRGNQRNRESNAERIDRMARRAEAPTTAAGPMSVEARLEQLRREAEAGDVIEGREVA